MADPDDLDRFVAAGGRGDAPAVRARLVHLRDALPEALPGVAIPWPRLIAELASRSTERGLDAITEDGALELALACAAVEQHPGALAEVEARYMSVIPAALAHMKLDPAVVDDIAQGVRTKLLVADADGEIKLVRYAGGGSLRGLVKVTAVRAAISLLRKEPERRPQLGDDLERLAERADNPELTFLKAHYRQAFAEAFEAAVGTLDARQRNVMRLHLLGGMTLEEVARSYGVNRSTVVRILQRARQRLFEQTRKQLGERLAVDRAELDSVVALIRSRLDVSLGRMLKTLAPRTDTKP